MTPIEQALTTEPQTMGQLVKATGLTAKEIRGQLGPLIKSGTVVATGQRRAKRYALKNRITLAPSDELNAAAEALIGASGGRPTASDKWNEVYTVRHDTDFARDADVIADAGDDPLDELTKLSEDMGLYEIADEGEEGEDLR